MLKSVPWTQIGIRLDSLFFTRGRLVYFSPDLLSHCQHLNQADTAQFVIMLFCYFPDSRSCEVLWSPILLRRSWHGCHL